MNTALLKKLARDPRGQEPALILGMSNEDYHAMTDVPSKSMLDLYAERPAKYRAKLDGTLERKETESMRLGTAAHTALLEPHTWDARYRTLTEALSKNSNAYKALKAEEAEKGRVLIDQDERDAAFKMAEAVMAKLDRIAGKVGGVNPFRLKGGICEGSLFWTDKATGLRLRTRPDWMIYQEGGPNFIIDLKSTRDAGEGFDKSTENFRYDVSAAFYSDGYEAVFGVPPDAYLLVCVESGAPHFTCVRYATPEILERGRKAYNKDTAGITSCQAANEWPDYPDDFVPMALPRWAKAERA